MTTSTALPNARVQCPKGMQLNATQRRIFHVLMSVLSQRRIAKETLQDLIDSILLQDTTTALTLFDELHITISEQSLICKRLDKLNTEQSQ